MNWINVEDEHFAEITYNEDGYSYSWESKFVDEPFLVALPLSSDDWCIERVVLTDEVGLQLFSDEEATSFGWDITDVTHWCKITEPN